MKRKKRPRTKLIESIEKILFQILIHERGRKCEICGARNQRLGLFHILPKGRYPRLRFYKDNLLIAGWFCCHFHFHHSYYEARDRIIPRIKELRGESYEDELREKDLVALTLSEDYLKVLKDILTKELEEIEDNWRGKK